MAEAEKNGPQSQGPASPAPLVPTPEYLNELVHELRNPLTPIRTAAELLRSLNTDARQLQAIDMISRQAVILTHMLEDLVDAVKGQRGLLALKRRLVDVAELMEQSLEPARAAIDSRRQNLFVTMPNESVQMDCDPVRLGQALQTLLFQASESTPEGGSIAARVSCSDDELLIEIGDDGAGIAPEALPHVFNVFARSTVAGTAQPVRGLSLPIVRNLIELHGGSIEARSEGVGRGSTFSLRLPLGGIDTAAASPADSTASLKILLIDDHEASVRGWLEFMVRGGHSVLTATSGELGIALAAQFQPDAVVVDIGLPGIDGFEVARTLRAQAQTRDAVLIAVSGYSLKQFRALEAYSAFRHYLLKPLTPSALLDIIEHTVKDATKTRKRPHP
jgi:CheY-like chemotaxis protein